ncbi:phosphatase PAP2 family protein [Arthrobacter sp. HY1533]|uniref:phosphatase PAP2 family protein n=1 Tax=Arthrobacter sp. HY1533 TaxID=2970919 RepID=UPI0022B9E948|nr:phosphatase PAP2 family protein [Arthrobacter sp. HY1533]
MNTHAASHRPGQHGRTAARIAAWPFLAAAFICLAGLLLSYRFFVKTTTGQFIDESALVEAAVARQRIGVQTAQLLDLLPVTSVVIAAIVVLFVTLARRRWKAAGIAIAAMAAANLSTQLIKAGLPDRPNLGVNTLALNSLPSGHSTLAASAAAAVFLVVSPRWRPAAAFVGGSYAIMAGLSTLINQWHRPADVIAAFFVVACWTALAALAVMRTGPSWNVWLGANQHWASARGWTAAAAFMALLAGLAGALVLRAAQVPGATSTVSYFLAGVGLIVVAGYVLAMAGTLLLTIPVRRRTLR